MEFVLLKSIISKGSSTSDKLPSSAVSFRPQKCQETLAPRSLLLPNTVLYKPCSFKGGKSANYPEAPDSQNHRALVATLSSGSVFPSSNLSQGQEFLKCIQTRSERMTV